MRVVVLGSGVVGVTSAYYLARAGHEVTVIDREAGPARATSFANAGQISPGYASPWAAPQRTIEASADAYALQLTHDRVGGTRAFVRFADEDLALLCPSRFARLYWYTHPPLGTRIANINGQSNPCP